MNKILRSLSSTPVFKRLVCLLSPGKRTTWEVFAKNTSFRTLSTQAASERAEDHTHIEKVHYELEYDHVYSRTGEPVELDHSRAKHSSYEVKHAELYEIRNEKGEVIYRQYDAEKERVESKQQRGPRPERPGVASINLNRRHMLDPATPEEEVNDASNMASQAWMRNAVKRPNREATKLSQADVSEFLQLNAPHLWFPQARKLKRKLVLHVGPTNSGKTHTAMKRLAEARSGVYCGPLRLLAWEVQEKLNSRGIPCDLVTGQECVQVENSKHVSCTIEMANLERLVDVAVIDEAQMLADPERGDAWTKVILGIPAKEVHICGDPTTVNWLVNLGLQIDEDVIVNRYERLTSLFVEDEPVKSIQDVEPGDAIIVFSRAKVYDMKRLIETHTSLKCNIVYGSLPPAVRKLQASTFNESAGEERVLVATDAIGMGLNLNIRRIVFANIHKFDGDTERQLRPSEVLQIGGRAGRYGSVFPEGYVNVLASHEALEYVRAVMEGRTNYRGDYHRKSSKHNTEKPGSTTQALNALPSLERACLLPTVDHLLAFMYRFPKVPLYRYLEVLQRRGTVPPGYFFGDMSDMVITARLLHGYRLSPEDLCCLCYAPFSFSRFPSHEPLAIAYAEALSQSPNEVDLDGKSSNGTVPIPAKTYLSHPGVPEGAKEIGLLEETYANLEIYLWLAQRFGTQRFVDYAAAIADRDLIATLIHEGLAAGTLKRKPKPPKSSSANDSRHGRRGRVYR